jgi:hypothetical protein
MNECILIFRGFARTPGWCHVVVGEDDRGHKAVLVGELDDNPGTSVLNATEQIADAVSRTLLGGSSRFELYEFVTEGLPDLKPTFNRIDWKGPPGRFSMPTWNPVDPEADDWLRRLGGVVRSHDYTFKALTAERNLEIVDARGPEALPWAI